MVLGEVTPVPSLFGEYIRELADNHFVDNLSYDFKNSKRIGLLLANRHEGEDSDPC